MFISMSISLSIKFDIHLHAICNRAAPSTKGKTGQFRISHARACGQNRFCIMGSAGKHAKANLHKPVLLQCWSSCLERERMVVVWQHFELYLKKTLLLVRLKAKTNIQ